MPLFGKDKDSKDATKSRNADKKNVTLTVQATSVTTTVSKGPARAEEVLAKQFIANTTADDRADKIRMLNGR
jgi:hypothetical protein